MEKDNMMNLHFIFGRVEKFILKYNKGDIDGITLAEVESMNRYMGYYKTRPKIVA